MKFLGIDGGGTKTEFLIIDEKGNIIGHSRKGTCHYKQTSLENFKNVIKEGIEEACSERSIHIKDIDYSAIGIPGYGEIEEDIPIIEAIVEEILSSKDYKCVNDSVVGFAGSLACKPGVNMVAGTGAIAFGMDSKGNEARASGWGHFCGDEGSAYWIGKKAIEEFTKQADGRLEKTDLYNIMKLELGLSTDFQLLDVVINKLEMKRDKIAQFSKIVYKAAEKNDKNAIAIFEKAAYEHYITIKAAIDQLEFKQDEEILVSYSGGVFNSGKYVLNPLENYLKNKNKNINLIAPILTPIKGAALFALKMGVGKIDEEVINNLKVEK